jgi:hypothetical protein
MQLMPALLTRTSTRPHRAITSSAKRRTAALIGDVADQLERLGAEALCERGGLVQGSEGRSTPARSLEPRAPGRSAADTLRRSGDDGNLHVDHNVTPAWTALVVLHDDQT